MAVSSSEGSVPEVDTEEVVERKESDLVEALHATGHFTCQYPNGLLSAVRLESIPGSRGVHVEVVHVLDLRAAQFGKSGLAMRAALLEGVSRDYEAVLHDVGLGDRVERRDLRSPFKNVSLLVLRGSKDKGVSFVHPTRTVYVVTRNVKPTKDLSWLTDSRRVVTIEEFALARSSDARSLLPQLKHSIIQDKWSSLESSIKRGWLGILALAAGLVGIISAAIILLVTSGSIMPSILTLFSAILVGLRLLTSSKKSLQHFEQSVRDENKVLASLGDSLRINKSVQENEDKLRVLGDISFVVSPLMATLANAIEAGATNESVSTACSILDECVRLAPMVQKTNRNASRSADEGLASFLGLFESLGIEVEKEELALSYVALTGHITSPLSFDEMIHHVEVLNNTLYDAGALRPDIKEGVDDKMNSRSMKETLRELDESLEEDADLIEEDDSIALPIDEEMPQDPKEDPASDEIDEDLLDDMMNSSADAPGPERSGPHDSSDDIPVIVADTVTVTDINDNPPTAADVVASQGKTNDSVQIVQTSLFDSEEGGSTGS